MLARITAFLNRGSREFLILLLSADVAFVFLHVFVAITGLSADILFYIGTDRGYAETFQYIKEFWIAGMLLWLSLRKRESLYLAWSVLFGYLLLDDSLELHEQGGEWIAARLNYPSMFGLRAEDLGELTYLALVGAFLLSLIAVAYFRSSPGSRKVANHLLVLLAILIFFGVVVDAVHEMVDTRILAILAGMTEEGGQMLVMSVICWYVFTLVQEVRNG